MGEVVHVYTRRNFGGSREISKSLHTRTDVLAFVCGVGESVIHDIQHKLENEPESDVAIRIKEWLKTFGVENHKPYVVNGVTEWIDPECMAIIEYLAHQPSPPNPKAIKEMKFMLLYGFERTLRANIYERKHGFINEIRTVIGNYTRWIVDDEIYIITPDCEI